MLQEDAMRDENEKNKIIWGSLIIICNNPLNPKFHISLATFTWKSDLKTLCLFAFKILRREKILGHQTYVPLEF